MKGQFIKGDYARCPLAGVEGIVEGTTEGRVLILDREGHLWAFPEREVDKIEKLIH